MKPSILFVDMNERFLPLVQAIADKGNMPILTGPIAIRAKTAGISCRAFEEFSPEQAGSQAAHQVQQIIDGLPSVTNLSEVQEAFHSVNGNFSRYTGKSFFEKMLKLVGHEIFAVDTFESMVQQCRPALIVLRTENAPIHRTIIRLAAKYQIPTLQIAHAIFSKPLAQVAGEYERGLRSDYITAFGARQKEILQDIGCDDKRIFLTGSPYWDELYGLIAQKDHREAKRALGLDPEKPVVLLCTSYALASSAFYPTWTQQLAKAHFEILHNIHQLDASIQVIVRPHPWELGRAGLSSAQVGELLGSYKQWLKEIGVSEVMISLEKKIEAILAADVVVSGITSTLIPEAMILKRPVLALPLNINLSYPPYTKEDGIVIVEELRESQRILKELLQDSSRREEIVKRQSSIIKEINHGHDGLAMQRLEAVIEKLADNPCPTVQVDGETDSIVKTIQFACSENGGGFMEDGLKSKDCHIHQAGTLSKGAVLDVGLKCTHSCGFCYYSYLDKSDDQFRGMRRANFRSVQDCKKILDLLKEKGFLNFDYTGGEATLHPDIIEITRYAHQELGLKGRMITLGQFLMQKMKNGQKGMLIQDLLDAGLTNFLLSIHAADEELFHKITGESFGKLQRAMNYLDEKAFHYTTNTVVFEWNYQHLPTLAREISKHAVYLHNFIIMNAYYEWNHDGRAFGVQAKYSDIYPYLKEAVQILESNNIGVNIRYAPLCAVKGMEKNLVGMVGVRYDPYEWMNAAGHFGGTPEHCAAVIPIKEGEIEQHLAYRELNGTLDTGVKITGARGEVKYFTEACSRCETKNACDGIDGNYLKLYGGNEFSAYQEEERAPLQKSRYNYTIPFMVKLSQYADMKKYVAQEFRRFQTSTAIPSHEVSSTRLIQIEVHPEKGTLSIPSNDSSQNGKAYNDNDDLRQGQLANIQSHGAPISSNEGRGQRIPKVSVVIVSYNYGRYLAEAVESALNQTFRDFEVIIVNDGSTDDTAEVADGLRRSHPNQQITVINQANAGQPAISRNNGIERAKGEYILCLDADDKIAPTMLEKCFQILETDTTVHIAYTDRLDFDGVDQVVRAREYSFHVLRHANHISHCALFRRKVWEEVGGYRTNVKGCEDWDFWVAAGAKGYVGRRIPEALFMYRRHDTGLFQEVLSNFEERAAQIVLNNREAYDASDIAKAEQRLHSVLKNENASRAFPLVSIIVPTVDRPGFLLKAIQSILNQTYRNFEIIVVNDGGKDVEALLSTIDIEERIISVRLPKNHERSYARNVGINLAKGKYVAYLDDDDQYLPEHIETLVTFLESSSYEVAYTDAYRIVHEKHNGRYVEKQRDVPYSYDFSRNILLRENYIPILCVMHSRACFDQVGLFDESLNTHEDWDLWIRMSEYFPFHHLKQITAEFSWRLDGTSTSSSCQEDFLATKARIHERYGLHQHGKSESEHPKKKSTQPFVKMQGESFDCSIIIPVFNKVELTQECLIHLAKQTTDISYEVIVVDNASSDGTAEFLSSLSGDIQVIANQENLGFAKGCNQGAKAARGKYFVFLNNDTIPQAGWLEALLEEVRNHADVAVVGSKLLFPDDTIQHAGIVFNRAKGLPYQWGRGHAPSSMFNHRREFQAVTAACMLVRRESFEHVNGFDERYVNGYEDVDLCLKIRECGEKIIYQPKSWLYHLEGKSEGRQDHMTDNAEYFLSRWGQLWLEDEDIVLDEERKFMTLHAQQNDAAFLLGGMGKKRDHSQSQLVVEVQKQLLGHVKGPFPQKDSMVALAQMLAESELWPSDSGVLTWGGMVCHFLGLYEHGLGLLRRALKLAEEPSIRLLYVQVAIKAGRLVEAQEHLSALKHSNSFGKDACLTQGVLFLQVKDFLEAKAMFQLVLAEDSTHVKARLGLGMAELGEGNGTSAFTCFQTVLNQCPDHREAIDLLLQAGTELKEWGQLSSQLEKFHNRNPSDCDIRFALASVYLRTGAVEKAKYQYDALKLCAHDYAGLDDLATSLSQASQCITDDSHSFLSHSCHSSLTTLEPTLLEPTIERKHVSIILGDLICAQLRLIAPFKACNNDLRLMHKVYPSNDVNNNSVHLPVGAEHIWLTQRIDIQDPNILKAARVQGTRIVRDLDDLLWKIPHNNLNSQVMTPLVLECFFRGMAQADCVTVSTEPLREALANLGIQASLLPNCLMNQQWEHLKSMRCAGRRPRVGWVGQADVHREDVAVISTVIEMLGHEVEWVFLGEIPSVGAGIRFEAETHTMVPLHSFPEKLASLNLDLALAPLAMNEFNEAKSDLRILQYGILGFPVVATDIFPYQVAPVTRVKNTPKAWAEAIRDHINNPESSGAQGERLKEWVLTHRMFDQYAPYYRAAWLGESVEKKELGETCSLPLGPKHAAYPIDVPNLRTYTCSIIIPVFNKLDLTTQCLTNLAKVTNGCSYEVIIVDNASTDGTNEFLSSLEGDVQIITNDSNLGFAKACNQGAKAAKGKFLVFLNNDTIPLDGWLSALVDEVEQHAEVAIVGSKLLYPDGTIQHAGVVFSKKLLTPYHLFNRLPSDFHAANVRQEFQAVTAACLLMAQETFHSVGGFDEQFVNGFEDVDLCLKIRESGKRVIYQPKSVLIHLEEQTPGRKNTEAELNNKRLLLARWGDRIVVDEDVYVVSAGYFNRYSTDNGKIEFFLDAFKSESEKSQWELVKFVEEALLKRRYGGLQQQDGQIDGVLRTSLSDVSKWPADMETLKWAASLCQQIGDVESKCGFFKRILDLGEDSEAREKLAREALKRGDLGEASRHVTAISTLDPHNGLGLWLQGILAIQSFEYTKATHCFQQALANGYDEQKTRLGLGMAWIGLGNAQNAWSAFEVVFLSDADNKEAVSGLIQSGTMMERWDKLQLHLTRYVDRNPTDCDTRFALAGVQFRAGYLDRAKEHLNYLRLISPDFEGLEDLSRLLFSSYAQENLMSTR